MDGVLVLLIVTMTLLVSQTMGHGHHECRHTILGGAATPRSMGEKKLGASGTHHRSMTAQSITWGRIRLKFNFTFTDPTLDIYASNGKRKACSSAGEVLEIGGGNAIVDCLSPSGEPVNIDACRLTCRAQDVLTPAKRATLENFVTSVKNTIERLLEVPRIGNGLVTIGSDPFDEALCSGLNVPPHEEAADFVVYVTTRPLHYLGTTLANAKPCVLEPDYDRPVMAHMNVAPATLGANPDLDTVLIHELTHGLGFSPGMFNKMRHPSDPTQTYFQRDPTAFPTGPIKGDGIVGSGASAAVNISMLGPGKRLRVVTPNVVAYARTYFGCSSLDGVEWENGGDSPSSTASHWEKRTLFFEYMTATQNAERGVISGFTLAFLTDMGFYRANLSAAEPMEWGKGRGCTWVDNCTAWQSVAPNYFCDHLPRSDGRIAPLCGYNRKFAASCNLAVYTEALPVPYQHFGNPMYGGKNELADHCPIGITLVAPDQRTLVNCLNASVVDRERQTQYGSLGGDSGRCMITSTLNQAFELPGGLVLQSTCNQLFCAAANLPMVRIGNAFYPCPADGHVVELLFPVRHRKYSPSAKPANSTTFVSYTSYDYYGVVECGFGLRHICEDTFGIDGDVLRSPTIAWPTIATVFPTEGTVEGGIEVTITGTNLGVCEHVSFGGLVAPIIRHVSQGVATMILPAVSDELDSPYGGDQSDGSGPVELQLWCNVTRICPQGCIVGHLQSQFTYTKKPTEDFDISSAFNDFITSTAGKAAGGGIAALLVIVLLFVLKGALLNDGTAKRKKELEARTRQQQQQQQQQPRYSPNRMDPYSQRGRLDDNLL